MTKQHIVNEIRRTATANGGIPLGRQRFFTETGIKTSDWHGKYWARWSDAVREAGLEPNQKTLAYADDLLIEKFISLARELGRLPVSGDLRLKARNDSGFPTVHVIRTDDPVGIEAYWHKRFESKRTNGEWFELSAEDVKAFRRRKFM